LGGSPDGSKTLTGAVLIGKDQKKKRRPAENHWEGDKVGKKNKGGHHMHQKNEEKGTARS